MYTVLITGLASAALFVTIGLLGLWRMRRLRCRDANRERRCEQAVAAARLAGDTVTAALEQHRRASKAAEETT